MILVVMLSVLAMTSPVHAAQNAPSTSRCVIDMGSNSFKRIIGSFEDGRYAQLPLARKTLGVGDDLSLHGRISETKLAEIEQALAEFKSDCAREGIAEVRAIGTAAFREAPNAGRVVEIAAKLGIPMEIASEEREAKLAYLVASLGQDDFAVVDNGSRSIELASKVAGQPIRFSVFNLGYRVAYSTFFEKATSPRVAIDAMRDALRPEVEKSSFMRGKAKLVGVEYEELAEVLFPPANTEGRIISRGELFDKLEEIAGATPEEFESMKRVRDIDRALPRLVVAALLVDTFGYAGIELTERELGTGLIIEAGMQSTPQR